jgi:hypothetical protein
LDVFTAMKVHLLGQEKVFSANLKMEAACPSKMFVTTLTKYTTI